MRKKHRTKTRDGAPRPLVDSRRVGGTCTHLTSCQPAKGHGQDVGSLYPIYRGAWKCGYQGHAVSQRANGRDIAPGGGAASVSDDEDVHMKRLTALPDQLNCLPKNLDHIFQVNLLGHNPVAGAAFLAQPPGI